MAVEGDKGAHGHAHVADLLGAAEFRQVDDKTGRDHIGADLLEQANSALCRAASRYQIIHQYDALTGASALIVVTEWSEFRNPDFERICNTLKHPAVFDGRNVYSLEKMEELGVYYESIGRKVVHPQIHDTLPAPHNIILRERTTRD